MKKQFAISVLLASVLLLTACNVTSKLEKIDIEQAKHVALTALGVDGEELSYIEAELKTRSGQPYYEVDITVDGIEYEFDIDAVSGVIIEQTSDRGERPPVTDAVQVPTQAPDAAQTPASAEAVFIGREKAFEIARAHAGYNADQASLVSCELDEDDGRWEYDVKFYGVTLSYSYEVDAVTGEVLEHAIASIRTPAQGTDAVDTDMNVSPAEDTDTSSGTFVPGNNPIPEEYKTTTLIGTDRAIAAALAHAGYAENEVTVLYCAHHTGNNDGSPWTGTIRDMYDVYFTDSRGMNYHYEIHAVDGTVESVESSRLQEELNNPMYDAAEPVVLPAGAITREKAFERALTEAGLSAGQVTLHACQPDYDNGKYEYDVLFQLNGTSTYYHCEINALSGKVIRSGRGIMWVGVLDEAKAKSIAIQQVLGSNLSHIVEFETDVEDGKVEYEGKIVYDGMEYEFEIDGYSGMIRSWEAEPLDD